MRHAAEAVGVGKSGHEGGVDVYYPVFVALCHGAAHGVGVAREDGELDIEIHELAQHGLAEARLIREQGAVDGAGIYPGGAGPRERISLRIRRDDGDDVAVRYLAEEAAVDDGLQVAPASGDEYRCPHHCLCPLYSARRRRASVMFMLSSSRRRRTRAFSASVSSHWTSAASTALIRRAALSSARSMQLS